MHNAARQATTPALALAGRSHPARSSGHLPATRLTGQLARTRPPLALPGLSANGAATANSPHRAHNFGGHRQWRHRQQRTIRSASETFLPPDCELLKSCWTCSRVCSTLASSAGLLTSQSSPNGPETLTNDFFVNARHEHGVEGFRVSRERLRGSRSRHRSEADRHCRRSRLRLELAAPCHRGGLRDSQLEGEVRPSCHCGKDGSWTVLRTWWAVLRMPSALGWNAAAGEVGSRPSTHRMLGEAQMS
jgi:hypothetical protein